MRGPLILAALGALALGAAFGALLLRDDPGGDRGGPDATPITIDAVDTEDPRGDGEHDSEIDYATDRVPTTYWQTSSYRLPNGELGKPGVGIVVRTSRPPEALVVTTDTPGFTAEIRSGGRTLAPSRQVQAETAFDLPADSDATEFTVWITNRGPHASVHVTEVTPR